MPNREETEAARQAVVDAAERLVNIRRNTVVVIVRGEAKVIRPRPGGRPVGPAPGEVSGYELRIIQALTDVPVGYRRLARAAGLRPNSYLRGRIARLVDMGYIRRTSRGLRRP